MTIPKDKTYVIKCKINNAKDFAGEEVSVYSTDHTRPDQWSEIAIYAQENPTQKIVILEGEQLDSSEKTLSLFLPLVELRNVYMPKSLIEGIKHNFRTIEYHEYLSAYGQMRTFVDLIKDYERIHPIIDIYELDRALNLIGGGWGKRNLFTRQLIDKVSDCKTIVRITDGKFDVASFCDTVMDDQVLAENTYETIMYQHAIHKLIYVVNLLLKVKTYQHTEEIRQDLLSIIKRIHEINDERNLGGEDPKFFDEVLERLDIERNFTLDGNLGIALEKKVFHDWVEDLPSLEELKNIYRKESQSTCYGDEAWWIYNISMHGCPVRFFNESEITYCNAMEYEYDSDNITKELYDWLLIKDIVVNDSGYAKLYFTEEMGMDLCDKLGLGTDDGNLPYVGDVIYFPKDHDQFPLFKENSGEITMLSNEVKNALLSVLRSEYQRGYPSK